MKICFFGSYEKGSLYSQLKFLLESKDVEILECYEGVNLFAQLFLAYPKLLFKHIKMDYDIMIIPWRGIMTLPLAKLIKKGPIVYFPYVSIYDTLINDRKRFRKNSIPAKILWFIDKFACKISDLVILENYETIKYFCKEYKLDPNKFGKFIWGADENKFPPIPFKETSSIFNVFFLGTFIPFHGVEIIVEAARILSEHDDIFFTFCGDGQTRKENEILSKKHGLKNIRFLGFVDLTVLRENLENADVCLGVFGSYEKRTNSMTNKIFQMLASQKPLITRDTPVMKEMFLENMKNCILVPPADAKGLANAILYLKNNTLERKKIAKAGYQTFKKTTTESWENFWNNVLLPLNVNAS